MKFGLYSPMRNFYSLLIVGFIAIAAIAAATHTTADALARSQPAVEKQASYTEDDYVADSDPLEPANRAFYGFNKILDAVLIKPLAKGYRFIMPQWGRDRIGSMLRNLGEPVTFLNALLQGDADHSFRTLWRFVINTTWGVGGAFDIAGIEKLKYRPEDFGQTLGHYGVGAGPYLMLPLFGPSSVRDAGGLVVDMVTNPFTYVEGDGLLIAYKSLQVIDRRESLLDYTNDVDATSLDPYVTYRSSYLQSRSRAVRDSGNN